ncbi:MAG: MerR family transcriptional regulator [Gemmatirosa sp.]
MTPSPTSVSHPPGHPIQVVARRTGLSADVIRAWEKRYRVVEPARSDVGRRLYSDADVERLRLLARATLTGRPIGEVAVLTPSALAALVHDEAARDVMTGEPPSTTNGHAPRAPAPPAARDRIDACLDALARFDVTALDATLRRASVALSAEAFLDSLVVPFWDATLERVRAGTLRITHEHIALGALRRALDRVVEAATSPLDPPDLVVSTPSGQPQELGALLATATAAAEGWRAVYVGGGLPAEAIAEATTQLGARAVTLSLGTTVSDRAIPRELRRLRALLPQDVAILVEGAATDAHRGVLREIDAIVLRDPAELRARLRTLRPS